MKEGRPIERDDEEFKLMHQPSTEFHCALINALNLNLMIYFRPMTAHFLCAYKVSCFISPGRVVDKYDDG